ncbi:MAG: 4Fe-4S binding protein [Proteobacteria bacterium]|nr:4Fe-4S binding protein [Pseudomonadota bacterium]
MNRDEGIYRQLATHLDSLPGGFPETESGVELRILKKLFSKEEAALACHLTLLDENPKVVAYRAGISTTKAESLLEGMARKGLIFYTPVDHGSDMYMAAQFVVGIWEMQVGYLDTELVELFEEYIPVLFDKEAWKTIPQLRTIPVEHSIENELKVLPYENARELVNKKTDFVVTPCICRKEKEIAGEQCKKPEETCITFGTRDDYFVTSGFGRKASKEEVLKILDLADKKGLVIQPNNGKEITWICCCCGCCCGVLRTIKNFPNPSELTSSPFTLAVNLDECDGCKLCIKRCQMDALSVPEKKVVFDKDRCIGCGLCVTSCKTESLKLVRKPSSLQSKIPNDIVDASIKTLKIREKAKLPNLIMMLLRSKRDRFLARNYR